MKNNFTKLALISTLLVSSATLSANDMSESDAQGMLEKQKEQMPKILTLLKKIEFVLMKQTHNQMLKSVKINP